MKKNPFAERLESYRQSIASRGNRDAQMRAALDSAKKREIDQGKKTERPEFADQKVAKVKKGSSNPLDVVDPLKNLQTLRDPTSMISPAMTQLGSIAGPVGGAVGSVVGNKVEDSIDPLNAVSAQNPGQFSANIVGDMAGGGVVSDVVNGLATGGAAVANPATLLADPRVQAEAGRVANDVGDEAQRATSKIGDLSRYLSSQAATLNRRRPGVSTPSINLPALANDLGMDVKDLVSGGVNVEMLKKIVGNPLDSSAVNDFKRTVLSNAASAAGRAGSAVSNAAQSVGNAVAKPIQSIRRKLKF